VKRALTEPPEHDMRICAERGARLCPAAHAACALRAT
jgi:hypothetical protein